MADEEVDSAYSDSDTNESQKQVDDSIKPCEADDNGAHITPMIRDATNGAAKTANKGLCKTSPRTRYIGVIAIAVLIVLSLLGIGPLIMYLPANKSSASGNETVTCPKPADVENAVMVGNSFNYEDVVTWRCNTGYKHQSGDLHFVCSSNGKWKGAPPTCGRVFCGPPDSGNNSVVGRSDDLYGDVVIYSCVYSFEYESGDRSRTCQADKSWSGSALQCTLVSCGAPDSGTNSVVGPSGNLYGDVVSYSCKSGSKYASGYRSRMCQADKSWSGSALQCTRVSCGAPDSGTNSVVGQSGNLYRDVVRYSCKAGYEYESGYRSRRCQADKSWSGSALQCTQTSSMVSSTQRWQGSVVVCTFCLLLL